MNNPFNPFENNMFNPEATKKALDEFKRQSDRFLQHKFGGQIDRKSTRLNSSH